MLIYLIDTKNIKRHDKIILFTFVPDFKAAFFILRNSLMQTTIQLVKMKKQHGKRIIFSKQTFIVSLLVCEAFVI